MYSIDKEQIDKRYWGFGYYTARGGMKDFIFSSNDINKVREYFNLDIHKYENKYIFDKNTGIIEDLSE